MKSSLKLFQRAASFGNITLNMRLEPEITNELKTYLTYVKETKASLPNYKEKMAQAYDFALDKMGMDFASSSIWNEYILFLKGVDAQGSYAENQKISAIRKIYHRGVVIPMLSVET